jgi:hypothetical protein
MKKTTKVSFLWFLLLGLGVWASAQEKQQAGIVALQLGEEVQLHWIFDGKPASEVVLKQKCPGSQYQAVHPGVIPFSIDADRKYDYLPEEYAQAAQHLYDSLLKPEITKTGWTTDTLLTWLDDPQKKFWAMMFMGKSPEVSRLLGLGYIHKAQAEGCSYALFSSDGKTMLGEAKAEKPKSEISWLRMKPEVFDNFDGVAMQTMQWQYKEGGTTNLMVEYNAVLKNAKGVDTLFSSWTTCGMAPQDTCFSWVPDSLFTQKQGTIQLLAKMANSSYILDSLSVPYTLSFYSKSWKSYQDSVQVKTPSVWQVEWQRDCLDSAIQVDSTIIFLTKPDWWAREWEEQYTGMKCSGSFQTTQDLRGELNWNNPGAGKDYDLHVLYMSPLGPLEQKQKIHLAASFSEKGYQDLEWEIPEGSLNWMVVQDSNNTKPMYELHIPLQDLKQEAQKAKFRAIIIGLKNQLNYDFTQNKYPADEVIYRSEYASEELEICEQIDNVRKCRLFYANPPQQ